MLSIFAAAERPAAWLMLIGATVVFIGVIIGLVTVGSFKWPTLLIAADLITSGFGAVQQAEEPEDDA